MTTRSLITIDYIRAIKTKQAKCWSVASSHKQFTYGTCDSELSIIVPIACTAGKPVTLKLDIPRRPRITKTLETRPGGWYHV